MEEFSIDNIPEPKDRRFCKLEKEYISRLLAEYLTKKAFIFLHHLGQDKLKEITRVGAEAINEHVKDWDILTAMAMANYNYDRKKEEKSDD